MKSNPRGRPPEHAAAAAAAVGGVIGKSSQDNKRKRLSSSNVPVDKKRKLVSSKKVPATTSEQQQQAITPTRKQPARIKENDQLLRMPEFQHVRDCLLKIGFQVCHKSKLFLPHHFCSGSHNGFDSVESLRAYLCQNGIPLPPGKQVSDVFDDQQESALIQWVRYHIVVPLLEDSSRLPCYEGIEKVTAKRILGRLGVTASHGGYHFAEDWFSNKHEPLGPLKWTDVEERIRRFGIPAHVLDKHINVKLEEKVQLLLFMADNRLAPTL